MLQKLLIYLIHSCKKSTARKAGPFKESLSSPSSPLLPDPALGGPSYHVLLGTIKSDKPKGFRKSAL